ncbi:MAG: LPS biosynthesis protein [Proteobacteria bacterium]|nr:MAG: LPS biosynthesis protein [Pseudomonadota bacterium]
MFIKQSARWLVLGLSFAPSELIAATDWETCSPQTDSPPQAALNVLRPPDLDKNAIYIEADQALFREQGYSELVGGVYIAQQDAQLQAQQAQFNRTSGDIIAQGKVKLTTAQLQVNSATIHYNLQNGTGRINDLVYLLSDAEGRGSSRRLIQETPQRIHLEDASYTTCPPTINTWQLQADKITLDRETDTGTARNVTFEIADTPVFYLPYFSFPLSKQRKSGFLTPSIGTDEKSGLRLSLPYYFNIAPNYDLTVTTNLLSKRGIQAQSEFRYLQEKHSGRIQYDILPSDQNLDNSLRYYFALNHFSQLGDHTALSLEAEGVSDIDYLNDLSSSLEASSTVNLERTLRYTHQNDPWTFTALAQSYQVLDKDSETYARLPQLSASWKTPSDAHDLKLSAHGEYTYFSNSQADNGHRFDIQAGISQRFANSYAYIEPSLKLRSTHYELERNQNTSISRHLPTVSIDTGLFFERELQQGNTVQTLEPRIYYTFTPYRNQADIPVFDSANLTPSYSRLFSDNRFAGADRIADTNRLSTSLTTRLQDVKQGREILRASIGQMYYFDDYKVTLPDESIAADARSEIVLELAGQLNTATQVSGTAFLDAHDGRLLANQMRLNYKDKKQRILNLGYGHHKNDYEAVQFSFATPFRDHWTLLGTYEHDLENNRLLETLAGIEYQSCCWRGRLVNRKYLLSDNKTYDDAIFAEFELKGLGNFGSSTRNLLENRIYGYE